MRVGASLQKVPAPSPGSRQAPHPTPCDKWSTDTVSPVPCPYPWHTKWLFDITEFWSHLLHSHSDQDSRVWRTKGRLMWTQ